MRGTLGAISLGIARARTPAVQARGARGTVVFALPRARRREGGELPALGRSRGRRRRRLSDARSSGDGPRAASRPDACRAAAMGGCRRSPGGGKLVPGRLRLPAALRSGGAGVDGDVLHRLALDVYPPERLLATSPRRRTLPGRVD